MIKSTLLNCRPRPAPPTFQGANSHENVYWSEGKGTKREWQCEGHSERGKREKRTSFLAHFWSTYLHFGNGRGGHATTDCHDNTEQLGWSEVARVKVMQKFCISHRLYRSKDPNLLPMTRKSAEDLVFRLWRQA